MEKIPPESMGSPGHGPAGSGRREFELALGVELNALLSASRALDVRTAAAFHPDLQPAAFHLARWLYAYGPAKPSTLAEAVGMDRSSTSRLIGRLKRLALVDSSPDPADKRGVVVSLTRTGNARVAEALGVRGSAFFNRTRDWPLEDLQRLTTLLREFNATAE
jgi:DNA-binding MarR family transcriptional regulator